MRSILLLTIGLMGSIFGGTVRAGEVDRFEELGTKFGDTDKSVAREVLMDPGKFDLDFPAFLVGVEKATRRNNGAPPLPELELGLRGWAKTYINRVTFANIPFPGVEVRAERMFVSHLIEFARPVGGEGAYAATVRYSAYEKGDLPSARDAFDEGRARLLGLRDPLEKAIERERPSHLIVFTTGWNTEQKGTFEGMKGLHAALAKTAGDRDFRPLMIGISWPSMSERLREGLKQATYNVKSCDADEVGLVWASTLVNQVLVPLRDDLQRRGRTPRKLDVVVIGHSFGARVVTWTAFCGGLRPTGGGSKAEAAGPDVVIGLQGAFSVARFVEGEGIEGSPYAERPAGTRFVYTCSEHDRAVETFNRLADSLNKLIHGLAAKLDPTGGLGEIRLEVPHIGGKTAFGLNNEGYRRVIDHRTVADGAGNLDRAIPASNEKVLLINASSIIAEPDKDPRLAPWVGAHGDIYNEGVGQLIWQVITSAPSSRPGPR